MEKRRLAVLFPGIGYHCDKPLLYYSARLARAAGYDVLPVLYTGFPERVRGDAEKMKRCYDIAQTQAEALLSGVRWADFDSLLFIGKSIGTAVASKYARERALSIHNVLLTPLMETFEYVDSDAVAFHGTADPWAETPAIEAACRQRGIPLWLTDGANHSLETGNVARDLQILADTMARVRSYIGQCE